MSNKKILSRIDSQILVVIKNYLYMNFLKVATLVVPLVTFPYLIKTLGSGTYGLMAWVWAITDLFILFVNFGFDISVTKNISLNKDDNKALSEIVSNTLFAKLLLLLIAFFILIILLLFYHNFQDNAVLFLVFFLLVVVESLMPLWYFMGTEKMRHIALISSFMKIFSTILILLLVDGKEDYLLVPLFYFASGVLSIIYAYYIIIANDNISIVKGRVKKIIACFQDSYIIFASSGSTAFRDKMTIVFIEHFIGFSSVAYFDLAQRFINVLITPFHLLSSTVYPMIARTKNIKLLKKILLYSTIATVVVYLNMVFFSENITAFLFDKNADTSLNNLIVFLGLTVIFGNASALLATNSLVVFNMSAQLFYSSVTSSLVYFLSVLLLYISGMNFNIILFAKIIAFVFFVEMLIRFYYSRKVLVYEI